MPKKMINGRSTLERIEDEWLNIITFKERPTVKEFCERVKISVSSLYHNYPEYALKIRQWRDGELTQPRKMSPVTKKKGKVSEAEALILIDKLRKEIISEKARVRDLETQCEKLKKQVIKLENQKSQNEILRSIIQQMYDNLKKHLSSDKANQIIQELENFEQKHLTVL